MRDQNRALDMMGGGFGDTDNLINSTMKKMQVWPAPACRASACAQAPANAPWPCMGRRARYPDARSAIGHVQQSRLHVRRLPVNLLYGLFLRGEFLPVHDSGCRGNMPCHGGDLWRVIVPYPTRDALCVSASWRLAAKPACVPCIQCVHPTGPGV